MGKRFDFTDFVGLVKTLRSENGCPWDRAQTHESLKPCMTEEAAELLAAIRIYSQTGDAENMREELGDILLQVVMHSVIAQEEGLFTIDDVVGEVSEKMIRRHPHVFGTAEAETPQEALANWEEIKKKEKEGKSWIKSPLREIPQELPALARACKVIKKSGRLYGAEKAETETVWEGLERRFAALKEAGRSEPDALAERFLDMLWEMCRLAAEEGIAAEDMLADRTAKEVDFFEPEYE